MKVIFIDLSGTIFTAHGTDSKIVEKRIKTLGDICKEEGTKIVISSVAKEAIDEKTLETDNEDIKYVFQLFKKYDIDCIGRTPTKTKQVYPKPCLPTIWKEDEIRLYLYYNPTIEAFCVLDDNDMITTYHMEKSDLAKLENHLVTMIYYSKDPKKEGLLESHKEEIKKVLKKENKYRNWRKDGTKKI